MWECGILRVLILEIGLNFGPFELDTTVEAQYGVPLLRPTRFSRVLYLRVEFLSLRTLIGSKILCTGQKITQFLKILKFMLLFVISLSFLWFCPFLQRHVVVKKLNEPFEVYCLANERPFSCIEDIVERAKRRTTASPMRV